MSREAYRRMRPALGTFVEVACERVADAAAAVEDAFLAVTDIEHRLSFQDAGSELSRLNAAAGAPLEMSAKAIRVLRLARAMGEASGGRFNPTVGGALVRRGVLPDHGGRPALDAGSPRDIAIAGRTARLRRGVRVTLDGIAKGYAVDVAVATLRRRGIAWGWVNAGGDLRAFGDVVVPVYRRRAGRVCRLGGLRDAALATSGDDAERAPGLLLVPDGSREVSGTWSVIARRAFRADALTKVAALVPAAERASVLARLSGRLA